MNEEILLQVITDSLAKRFYKATAVDIAKSLLFCGFVRGTINIGNREYEACIDYENGKFSIKKGKKSKLYDDAIQRLRMKDEAEKLAMFIAICGGAGVKI